ncbi:MAG: methyltransferase domain-containing protein, partial [Verrucomicrobiaceae bacterium]
TYDCVVVSRVLTCPPDLEACLSEIRRVLKKGGIAIIGEIYTHEKTVEFGKFVGERSREIGVDAIDLYRKHFDKVDLIMSDRYAGEYQLHNRITRDGKILDDFPYLIRIPDVGFKDVLAVCHA